MMYKITKMQETLVGNDEGLKEVNASVVKLSSKLVVTHKAMKEGPMSYQGWTKKYSNATDKGIRGAHSTFPRTMSRFNFLVL